MHTRRCPCSAKEGRGINLRSSRPKPFHKGGGRPVQVRGGMIRRRTLKGMAKPNYPPFPRAVPQKANGGNTVGGGAKNSMNSFELFRNVQLKQQAKSQSQMQPASTRNHSVWAVSNLVYSDCRWYDFEPGLTGFNGCRLKVYGEDLVMLCVEEHNAT